VESGTGPPLSSPRCSGSSPISLAATNIHRVAFPTVQKSSLVAFSSAWTLGYGLAKSLAKDSATALGSDRRPSSSWLFSRGRVTCACPSWMSSRSCATGSD
jgi:hypothetical protein